MGYSTPPTAALSTTLSSTSPAAQGWNTATFTKPDVTVAGSSGAWLTANSPITLFTVTGLVLVRFVGRVTTGLTSTAGTGTIAMGVTASTTVYLAAATINGAIFPTNAVIAFPGGANNNNPQLIANTGGWWEANGQNVILTIATNNMTAGGVEIDCQWIPISSGATVVAVTA